MSDVAELVAVLKQAREHVAEDCDMRTGYGAFPGGDPRDFSPDPECSTEQERAAHAAAVERANADEGARDLEPSHRWFARGTEPEGSNVTVSGSMAVHVEVEMFGLGTYRDGASERLLKAIDAAIAKATT